MAEMDTGTSGGGGDDGDGDGTGSFDDGSDTTFSATWDDIAPSWLTGNAGTLQRFLNNPIGFVAGAVLAIIIAGIETVTESFLTAIFAVYDAVAVVFTSGASLLTDAGAYVATELFEALLTFNDAIIAAASSAGLAAPIIGTLVLVVEGIILLWTLETLVKVAIDAVPGGGGLIS